MEINLPYPPTLNTYWRHARGRHYISAQGKSYRRTVILLAKTKTPMLDRLKVEIKLWMPDRRRRDIDNLSKVLLDALAHAGVYEDDSQIDVLTLSREGVEKQGRCLVSVEPYESTAFKTGVYS